MEMTWRRILACMLVRVVWLINSHLSAIRLQWIYFIQRQELMAAARLTDQAKQ
jgi:hypothetical protein